MTSVFPIRSRGHVDTGLTNESIPGNGSVPHLTTVPTSTSPAARQSAILEGQRSDAHHEFSFPTAKRFIEPSALQFFLPLLDHRHTDWRRNGSRRRRPYGDFARSATSVLLLPHGGFPIGGGACRRPTPGHDGLARRGHSGGRGLALKAHAGRQDW